MSTLEGWTNPFKCQKQDLVCLSTGKKATDEVASDLLQAKDVGERAYRSFSKERLEPNESQAKQVKFNDKMSKTKLKTFSNLNKKVKLGKGTPKEVVLKADRALFAHMIVIAEARKLSMKEVLTHPLGPIPWSLAASDGSLRKTAKSSLAKELQKNVPAVDTLPQQSACIIDGMAMVQKLKGDHKTFAEVADTLLTMVLREGATSTRIDVVFDVYRNISIKNIEREKRGDEMGNEFRSIRPDHKVVQWKKFLSNTDNKQQLITFIVTEWRKEPCRKRLPGKTLYATAGEECYEISSERSTLREDLR